jgi:hypothetical protein
MKNPASNTTELSAAPLFTLAAALSAVYTASFRQGVTEATAFATRLASVKPGPDALKAIDTDIALLYSGAAKRMIAAHFEVTTILAEQTAIVKQKIKAMQPAS